MAKRYSILYTPVLWCFCKSFYRDAARNWRGICALYLLLLLAIVCIPYAVRAKKGYSEFMTSYGQAIIDQVPPITIENGEVSTPVDQPYVMEFPEGETGHPDYRYLAVIDTTGQITNLRDAQAPLLLTRTELIFRGSEYETRTMDLRAANDFRMDKHDVARWADTIGRYLPYALYPIIVIGLYVFRLLQILFYGLIGLIFSAIFRARLGYAASVRLSAVAVTPVILADAILDVAGVHLGSGWTWGGIAIGLGLLLFGAAVNRTGAQPPPVRFEALSQPPGGPGCQQPPPPPPGTGPRTY